MKKFVLAIIMLGLFSSFISCSAGIFATEEPYLPTRSPKPDWLVRWLSEPTCQPPCWENITPSETSYTNALAIAKTISGFELGYVNEKKIQLNYNQGYVLLVPHGDTNIQEIRLDIEYTSVKLSEVVNLYGFPDEMISFGSFDNLSTPRIDLLYYDLSMVIIFYPLPNNPWNRVSLSPDIYVGAIHFYVPQLENYFSMPLHYGMNVSPTIKLNGYGDYDIPVGGNSP